MALGHNTNNLTMVMFQDIGYDTNLTVDRGKGNQGHQPRAPNTLKESTKEYKARKLN